MQKTPGQSKQEHNFFWKREVIFDFFNRRERNWSGIVCCVALKFIILKVVQKSVEGYGGKEPCAMPPSDRRKKRCLCDNKDSWALISFTDLFLRLSRLSFFPIVEYIKNSNNRMSYCFKPCAASRHKIFVLIGLFISVFREEGLFVLIWLDQLLESGLDEASNESVSRFRKCLDSWRRRWALGY